MSHNTRYHSLKICRVRQIELETNNVIILFPATHFKQNFIVYIVNLPVIYRVGKNVFVLTRWYFFASVLHCCQLDRNQLLIKGGGSKELFRLPFWAQLSSSSVYPISMGAALFVIVFTKNSCVTWNVRSFAAHCAFEVSQLFLVTSIKRRASPILIGWSDDELYSCITRCTALFRLHQASSVHTIFRFKS